MGCFSVVRDMVNWFRHSKDAKEFSTYIVFVVIFSIIAFAGTPGDIQYHLNGYARSSLNLDDENVGVASVSDAASLDVWMREALPEMMFPQETYDGAPLDSVQRLYLVGEGRGMGAVRVRNVRGPFRTCDTPMWLTEVNGRVVNCSAPVGIRNYVTTNYGQSDAYGNLPDGINFTKPWSFQSRGELNTTFFAHVGQYGTYPQDGFNLDVIPNVSPDVLADKVQQCRPLLERSILACMRNQSVEFDPAASPPPPVVVVPAPPPLQLGSADTAGMVLTSASTGIGAFIMEVNKTFELGEGKTTDSYTFKIHNPGKVRLSWRFDAAAVALLTNTSWIVGAPALVSGNVDPSLVVGDPQSTTTGTEVTINVQTGAGYTRLPGSSASAMGAGNPANVTLFLRSVDNAALVATVTLSMTYKLTSNVTAANGTASVGGNTTNATAAAPGGRKLLQAATPTSTPAPSVGPTINPPPPAANPGRCTEGTGSIDLDNLPAALDLSRCGMDLDKDRECEFPYVGFHHMLNLSRADSCGECKCKSEIDAGCLATCSAAKIYSAQADLLRKYAWLDRQTRAVIVDFTVLHMNSNLFQTIRILFEFPSYGGIMPKTSVTTFRLYRYATTHDIIIMGLEIVFCIMILYYTIEELLEFRKNKLAYLSDPWNIMDWINLIIFYVVIGLRVGSLVYTAGFDYNAVTVQYIDFQPIGFALSQELNVVAINFFLMYFKVFKYLSKVPRMDSMLLTVSTCSFDLFLFGIMFSIIMFGFSAAFYLVFGPYLAEYRTLATTFSTLFRILLGDFSYSDLVDQNSVMAGLLFFSFILVGFMLLMNMLLAIVCDSFADVKGNQTEEDLNYFYNLRDRLTSKAKELFSRNKQLNAITAALKAGDGNMDNLVDENELAKALKHNPKAYEILKSTGAKELLKKYDVDGDGVLDPREMTKILKDIAEKEVETMMELKTNEEAQLGASRSIKEGIARGAPESRYQSGSYGGVGSEVDLTAVNERLDKVEGQIKEMSRNVAKKLALMIDLMMSMSDQITNVQAAPAFNMGGNAIVPGRM